MNTEGTIDVSGLIGVGWRYTDWPRMEVSVWEAITQAMGEEGKDYHLLTLAVHYAEDGVTVVSKRGQMVISPAGLERLGKWRDARKERKT